ncbi:hypothetical protein ACFWAA_10875 [Streptomyces sp. NPDC059922]|uniref:hypothetical protein n=1 Tax=Streptomyces sp. NPDC059922 TaxID=3347005 RepID=UPI0036558FD7
MSSHDDMVAALMRDLRVLGGCDAVLSALVGGADVDAMLALVQRHAVSAAERAERILADRQCARAGGDLC